MSQYKNKELITEIQNGNEKVLVYLSKKYFQAARRVIRIRGVKDSMSPEIFSAVLTKAWLDIRHHKFPSSIEFETFFFNSLQDYVHALKHGDQPEVKSFFSEEQRKVVSQCVSILEEGARDLVQAYYADGLSFEKIADQFNFSNAVIAQHEVYKAMCQLEGIVKLRLHISVN